MWAQRPRGLHATPTAVLPCSRVLPTHFTLLLRAKNKHKTRTENSPRFSLLPWNRIDCTQLRLWAQRYHRNNLSQRPSSRLTRHAHPRGGWQGPGLFFVSILKGFKRKVHLELLATPKPASQERPTLPEGRGWGCWLLFCKKLYTSFMHQLGAGWQVTSTR